VPRKRDDREEAVAEFVLRRLGQEWLDYAINPMIAGIYAGDPRRLSVLHAFPKLHQVEQRYGSLILGQILGARDRKRRGEVSKQEAKKVSFDDGLQVLTDSLATRLGAAIRLNTTVTALERTREGWWRIVAQTSAGEAAQLHRAVLLTAPAYRLAQIALRASPEPAPSSSPPDRGAETGSAALTLAALAEVHYPPVASVVLGFRREDVDHPLDGFGMLVPEVERFNILGTLFSSSLFPNRAPAGHVTLTTYVGGVRSPDLALKPTEGLFALTLADLGKILGVRGKPTFRHAVLYRRAIPQYEVGYGRFKTLLETIEAKAPGLFFAGHYRNGISLGDSIIAGHDVAQRIGAAVDPGLAR